MALNWEWNEKCGEITVRHDFGDRKEDVVLSLYEGNAYLIMLHEFDKDGKNMYELFSFWADADHMKNCLGLDKRGGYDRNLYAGPTDQFLKVRLNKAKCRRYKEIITALAKAFDTLTIEIYNDEDLDQENVSEGEDAN